MTASELLPPELMDIINESDESDQECFSLNSRIPFEDLRREFDIARYYKRLSNCNVFSCEDVLSRRHKTKSTQTEPDVADIPLSWILVGEKLIEELYTGLGNIINTMYHTPNGHTAMKQSVIDPKGLKYFTYENGYWQSTLLPNIKILDRPEMDRQNRILYSEDTKKKLGRLLAAATKLRNIIPYVVSDQHLDPQADGDKSCSRENSPNFKRRKSLCGCTCLHKSCRHIDDMDVDTEISEGKSDSGRSSECSPEYCNIAKQNVKRVKKEPKTVTKNVILEDSREQREISGISVSTYKPAHASSYAQPFETGVCKRNIQANYSKSGHLIIDKVSTSVVKPASTKVLASSSNESQIKVQRDHIDIKTTGEKRPLIYHENCTKNKTRVGSNQKNFIRRNIMALRNTTNHVSSSAVRNDPGCSSVTHEANKSRIKYSREMYEKFLR